MLDFLVRRPRRDRKSRSLSPSIEPMEDRVVPSVFTVTNASGGMDPGSLGYAVLQSNVTPGRDTISFGFSSGAIHVNSPYTLTDSVTINGPSNYLYLDGGNSHQIFQVNPGVGALISNLTFTAGHGLNGGAVINYGDLTLINDVFTQNTADSAGGALATAPGASTVTSRCTFTSNYAGYGGGAILNLGQMGDVQSTFGLNVSYVYGGAVYNGGGFWFQNSSFNENTAFTTGGGIFVAPGGAVSFTLVLWGANSPNNVAYS